MTLFSKKSKTPQTQQKSSEDFFGVQAKLNIGKSNDKYELEADRVADQVVTRKQNNKNDSFFAPAPIIQKKPISEIQKQVENNETIQTKEGNEKATLALESKLKSSQYGGSTLSNSTKNEMESGFGTDFSQVKIHTDTTAVQMNQELGSQAFANGNNIYFNEGKYNPNSQEGKHLLAHELTHTVQQGASKPAIQKKEDPETTETNEQTNVPEETNINESSNITLASEGESDNQATLSVSDKKDNQEENSVKEEKPSVDKEEKKDVDIEKGKDKKQVKEAKGEKQIAKTTPRSAKEDPNFKKVTERVDTTAKGQQEHETSQNASGAAQSAALAPENERESQAQAGQVDEMESTEAGEFNAITFKTQLMDRIKSMQLPSNQEQASNFEENNNIQEVSNAATQDVQNEKEKAAGPVEQTSQKDPNVEAIPSREVLPMPEAPIGEKPTNVDPSKGMPPKRGEQEVSQPLQDNMAEVDQKMAENEITDEQLAKSNEPSFLKGLDQKAKAKENTETAPQELRIKENSILNSTQQNAENTGQLAVDAMHQDREMSLNQVVANQGETATTDTAERDRIGQEINTIYENTKTDVEKILSDLDTKVSSLFTAGAAVAKIRFENYVARKMSAYKSERYSGARGKLRWIRDKFKGLPDTVNQFFVDGRQVYIDYMDGVITEIAQLVANKLTEAKKRITTGKQEVQDYVLALPNNLQKIGQDAAETIETKFDELEETVKGKQDELIDSLAQQYNEGLQEVDARIEEMKAANRGLIDMVLDAVVGIVKTIIAIKDMLTNLLVAALSAIGAIISDPIGFLSNLISGIKQGFENFGANIMTHLTSGLVGWLTGSLGPMGIKIPDDLFSLSGIFDLVGQILGLSWDYIRQKAVKHLGEPVVQALETGFEVFMIIKNEGIAGLWKYIKDEFNDLQQTVMEAIKEMVITKVIQAGIKWVLGLMSPAGAFVKAAMMIIDIVKFFVEKASQIMELVNAFIEGIKAVASGSVGAVAKAIENALAKAIPVIIGFLASLLGVTGLTEKIQKIIGKIRKRVDKAIDKIILKAKKSFKGLLKKGKVKVKGAIAAVLQWWKKKKKFKNKGGEDHELSFRGTEENATLYIASANPQPVKDYIAKQKANPSSDKVALAKAEGILDTKLKVIIKGSTKAADEAAEKKRMKEVTAALNEISEALKKLSGDQSKPDIAQYSYSGNKPSNVSVTELHNTSKNKKGSIPKNGPGTGTTGWKEIHDNGLSKISDKWVQMHILNKNFGGPGLPENLIPGPNSVNKGAKQERFDTSVSSLLKKDSSVIWINATIDYHNGTASDKKGNAVDLSMYAKNLKLEAGLNVPDGSKWDKKSATKIKTTISLPKPNFTAKDKISLNNSTGTNMKESGLSIFNESYSNSLIKFIKRERKFLSFADFEVKLDAFAQNKNSHIPPSKVIYIVNFMKTNKKDIKLN
ncbi:DUF4157 domain-containing protein [Flavobacterium sp. J27]|uniref:eCIS core domain-containing protein n=1 Tax=Flavobacterium sp. J27 TaxID=2060419 RepID=UPI00102F472B|nr:DUF4157 domain-containing protein [Flavobacterium sp. J27]